MKSLADQLRDMPLDRLVTTTHDHLLTHDTIPDAYVAELLHRITLLRSRNRELSAQVSRLSKPTRGTAGDRLRRDINAHAQSIRAICDRITSDTRHIR
ncbi:hypothetical protein [uncultured Corynebacterium sp.]|uniref:hypothetical protein n=1 Tax=uncultured Corynebacterium sp. TaxID=159447 RepID=UPI0025E87E5E|nr:hypothetical protein [uncultured Corynebacterium sp.]